MTTGSIDLDRLGEISRYFALAAEVPPGDPDWHPVSRLVAEPASLDAAIDRTAVRMGTDNRPVAASIFLQGWAARLTSIYAGSVVLFDGAVPDLAPERLWYRLPDATQKHGPVGLATSELVALDPKAAWRRLADTHLAPLVEAVKGRVRLGRRQLWGNAGSSFAGSLGTLAGTGHGALEDLISQPWAQPDELADLGAWVVDANGLGYRRTTCCDLEKIPGRARCGDCTLNFRDGA